jgi:eukaryotic-like serine/threonine-protein kinase
VWFPAAIDAPHHPDATLFAGRYQLEELLARGGMGRVFSARHAITGQSVALKLLEGGSTADPKLAEKFALEARVASLLRSRHVVQVYDAGVDAATSTPYLAMELLRGETLGARVERQGRLAPWDALRFLQQLAEGLRAAHDYVDASGRPTAIIHRDIKPQNLFIAVTEGGE